jgi:hypothetical protein
MRLEGLGKLKRSHLIGTQSRDLPACSIVPQPTTLPRAPQLIRSMRVRDKNGNRNFRGHFNQDFTGEGKPNLCWVLFLFSEYLTILCHLHVLYNVVNAINEK